MKWEKGKGRRWRSMISPTLDNGDEQKEGEWLEESHHGESTGSPEQHLFLSFWSSFGESKHLSLLLIEIFFLVRTRTSSTTLSNLPPLTIPLSLNSHPRVHSEYMTRRQQEKRSKMGSTRSFHWIFHFTTVVTFINHSNHFVKISPIFLGPIF